MFDGSVYFTGNSNNTLKNVIFTNNKEIRIRGIINITLENVTLDVTGTASYISIASQGTGNITIKDFKPSSSVNYTLNSSLGMWINFSRSNITFF